MSTAAPQAAVSRGWLTWSAAALAVLIGVVLITRSLSGNTIKEQRAAAVVQKREDAVRALPAADSAGYSAVLARRAEDAASAASPLHAQLPSVQTAASTTIPTSQPSGALPAIGTVGLPTGIGGLRKSSRTGSQGDELDEAELKAYELAKLESSKDAARGMGISEATGALATAGASTVGLGAATSPNANAERGQAVVAPEQSASDKLVQAYLRSAGGGPSLAGTGSGSGASAQSGLSVGGAATGREDAFLRGLQSDRTIEPLRATPGLGRYALLEGTSIPITMGTNVSSDLAGPCLGRVARDVYDSVTGSQLLIPADTKAICTYASDVVTGQERLLLAFTRLIFPSGASVALGGMQGADALGGIGVPAEVNNRFWKTFGSSLLVGLLTRSVESRTANSGTTINVGGGGPSATAAGVFAEVSRRILDRYTTYKPELRLSVGDSLRLTVTRDMVLDPSITKVR